MQKMKVIIMGAGGHGKAVADALLKENKFELVGFADDKLPPGTPIFYGYEVICSTDKISDQAQGFVVAIGNNKIRAQKYEAWSKKLIPVNVIHPFSAVALDVRIGYGTVILAGAVVNASAVIGENCIINSNSLIDHDCKIENHVHVSQSVSLGSGNHIEEYTFIEQGKVVKSAFY